MKASRWWDVLIIAIALLGLFCAFKAYRIAYGAEIPVQQTTCSSHVIARRADSLWLEVLCIVPQQKAGK